MEQQALCRAAPERDDANHFNSLPDEIILEIFTKLPRTELGRLALACQRFSRISEDHALWKRIVLMHRELKPGTMDKIMGRQVKDLTISRSRVLSPIFLESSTTIRPDYQWRLSRLHFSQDRWLEPYISSESLVAMLTRCRQIKELCLDNVDITDDVLETMAANNKKLQILSMSFREVESAGAEAFKILLNGCTKLRSLELTNAFFYPEIFNAITGNLPSSLRVLKLSESYALNDRHLVRIVENCPHLTDLDLIYCDITGEAMETLSTLSDLRRLGLRKCVNLSFDSLLYLNTAKSLTYLNISGCRFNDDQLGVIRDAFRGFVEAEDYLYWRAFD